MSGHCYFPPLNGPVDCTQCEAENCRCHGRHQRNRRDLSYTSGRCPRLPDLQGLWSQRRAVPMRRRLCSSTQS